MTIESTFIRTELYPWSYIEDKDKEFWCARLGQYVRLTNNVESNGTYYVYIAGTGSKRQYPVKGHEIVLADDKSAKKFSGDANEFFPINKSNWTQIKNFLADNFIPSYAWASTPDKSNDEVKADMLAAAKSPRNGLARLIEQERQHQGHFLDKSTFSERMKTHYESFPWLKVSDFLDYSVPMT